MRCVLHVSAALLVVLASCGGGSGRSNPAGRQLLTAADFTYLGHYIVSGAIATDLSYGQGFTHRYVNGELRFLIQAYNAGKHLLLEVREPSSFGATISSTTNRWQGIWGSSRDGGGRWRSLWWDAEGDRLWTTDAIDYPNDTERLLTGAVLVRRLNPDGTIANLHGPFGLENVGARAVYGGVQKIPLWFQAQYGVGKYAIGWGGYTSRLAIDLVPSLGLTMFALPDPTALPDGSDVPASQYRILADHRSGSRGTDWYAAGGPTLFDRGQRNPDVRNEFDGGAWKSPAPDGAGRWVWGDSYWNTGVWIDDDAGTRKRHGFIAIGTFFSGRAWYETSTLHCERRTAEIHVFNPAELGEVAQGRRPAWSVQPAASFDITPFLRGPATPNNLGPRDGEGPDGGASGATFDPLTNRLYIMSYGAGATGPQPDGAIYVFHVGGQ